jgi:phospholipid-binding lipoprotein MlaA
MHGLNMAIDRNCLKPVASGYKKVIPSPVRQAVSNFLENLKEPYYMVSYILAAQGEYSLTSLFRFVVNSIFGVLGFFDVGEKVGLSRKETSLRKTLKSWEVPTGDYLVMPILGPSSTRDVLAEPVSWYMDPVTYFIGFPYMLVKAVLSMVSARAENSELIDATIKNSIDFYLTAKILYEQQYGIRKSDVKEKVDEEFAEESTER